MTIALEGAPYGPGVDEAKVSCNTIFTASLPVVKKSRRSQNLTLQSVVSILNSTKSTEIPNVVKSLSQDAQDTLMKYLYKGMGLPGWGDVSGSVLLGWHEKVRTPLDHLHPVLLTTQILRFTVDGSSRDRLYCTSHD